MDKKQLGEKGEQLAVDLLLDKGYEIIERNYRYGHGEIDIVAKDTSNNFLVFLEVKTRRNLEYGEPEYALSKNKKAQIKKIAQLYLYDKEIKEADCRFDVIAVIYGGKAKSVINHYENAFM